MSRKFKKVLGLCSALLGVLPLISLANINPINISLALETNDNIKNNAVTLDYQAFNFQGKQSLKIMEQYYISNYKWL